MLGSMAAMTQPPAQPPAGGWPSPEASARWNPPHRTPHLPQPQPQQPHPQPQQLQPQSEPLQPRLQQQPLPPAATLPAPPPMPIPRDTLDHPVFFNPAPAVLAWRRARGAFVWSIGSLVVNGVVWAAIWWFYYRDDTTVWQGWFPWVLGFSLAVSAGVIAWRAAKFVRAKRELAALHEGLALGVGRGGLFLADAGAHLPWTQVAGLDALPGRLGGSRRLVVRGASGQKHTLPLDHLATNPAALDGAVRAMSGGRSWIELGRLDD